MMVTLQRVEQDTVSSQSLAYAIENLSKTGSDVSGSRLRMKDQKTTLPAELVRQHTPWRPCARGRSVAGMCRSEAQSKRSNTADHEGDAQSDTWTDGLSR